MSATIDDLQDTYPVFSTILVDYYAATPGAGKGRKGNDATLLARFSHVGGENHPEFEGLHDELVSLARRPSHAAALINHAFGLEDENNPAHVTPAGARSLVNELTESLYDTTTSDSDEADEEERSWVDARADAFVAYRSHVLTHLPKNLPGSTPAIPFLKLQAKPLAGRPITTVACAIAGVIIVAVGMAALFGLRAIGAPEMAVIFFSFPFLIIGGGLVIWAASVMLLIRQAIIHPDDEEDDEDDEPKKKDKKKDKDSSAIKRALKRV